MTLLGTTLFSFTPDWRAGGGHDHGAPPARRSRLWPGRRGRRAPVVAGFPAVAPDDERAFADAVDRLGLTPVALGVYTDLYRRAGPDDDRRRGVRRCPPASSGPRPGSASRSSARRWAWPRGSCGGCRRGGAARDRRDLRGAGRPTRRSGSRRGAARAGGADRHPHLGLTLDFSLTTPALPDAFGTALRRFGLTDDEVDACTGLGADAPDPRPHRRRARRLSAVIADEGPLNVLVAGVLGRCGRSQPADWAHALPAVRHAHAKFWDPDVESVRAPHAAWLRALDDADYAGTVLSEWGGHELLDTDDADALEVTRAHVGGC